jgi:hypothetical protein
MALHPQTAIAMGNLLHRLAGNPATRAQTLADIKKLDPSYRLPADVEIASLRQELAAKDTQNKREEETRRAQNRRNNQRKKLVDSHGEDIVKQIEEVTLKKYPHLDLEDAAKLYAADNGPVMAPTGSNQKPARHGQYWEFPDIPGLLSNPDKAASDMAYSIIDDLRGRPGG